MSVKLRRELEARIASEAAKQLHEAGFVFRVDNGDGIEPDVYTTPEALAKAMFLSDDDRLYVYKPGAGVNDAEGWVWFIYGNSGYDVISDYTTNLEPHLVRAQQLAEQYAD